MRRLAVLAVAVLAVAGCGGGGDDSGSALGVLSALDGLPDCAEWTERPVSHDEWRDGCQEPAKERYNLSGSTDCADGRVLWWNDAVWGYEGEAAHAYAPGAEQVAPQAERDAC